MRLFLSSKVVIVRMAETRLIPGLVARATGKGCIFWKNGESGFRRITPKVNERRPLGQRHGSLSDFNRCGTEFKTITKTRAAADNPGNMNSSVGRPEFDLHHLARLQINPSIELHTGLT